MFFVPLLLTDLDKIMEREEVLKTLEAKTEELDFTSGEFRGRRQLNSSLVLICRRCCLTSQSMVEGQARYHRADYFWLRMLRS